MCVREKIQKLKIQKLISKAKDTIELEHQNDATPHHTTSTHTNYVFTVNYTIISPTITTKPRAFSDETIMESINAPTCQHGPTVSAASTAIEQTDHAK